MLLPVGMQRESKLWGTNLHGSKILKFTLSFSYVDLMGPIGLYDFCFSVFKLFENMSMVETFLIVKLLKRNQCRCSLEMNNYKFW